jgi:hypothetical protein
MVMKHIQGTEYAKTLKDLLREMKVERMVKRRFDNGGNLKESEEDDIDDWEHHNYKDTWLPSFDRLKLTLISHYKERKFSSSNEKDGDKSKSLPAMVSKIIDGTVKVMLAPAFGLKPRGRDRITKGDSKRKRSSSRNGEEKFSSGNRVVKDPTCWACGKVGHRSTDSECKAEPGTIHENAPKRARYSAGAKKDGVKPKATKTICKFYQDTGKCKFGAKCKFAHDQSNGSNLKGLNFSSPKGFCIP